MKRYTLKALAMSLGLLTNTLPILAQDTHCGFEAAHQYHLQHDVDYAKRLQQLEAKRQAYQAPQHKAGQKVLVTIPVVVHVVHNGETVGTGRNISDAQILSQIDVLNKDYRFTNADASLIPAAFQSLATDMEIEFCLAIRDPQGNATSGIERIDGGKASWLMSEVETTLKPSTIWDPDQYLNIWTLQLGGGNAQTLGYSSAPGQNPDVDGVVVQFRFFGTTGNVTSPYNKGRTCTHEIGHFLGLNHVWGFTDPNVSNCAGDDGIADTPNQEKANYGCPTFPKVSCSNGPNGDMFMNYMDYADDACMYMFTNGQKAFVNTVLGTVRTDLVNSKACTRYTLDAALLQVIQPQGEVCEGTFRPVVLIQNQGSQTMTRVLINYVTNQSNFNQIQWTGSLATGESEYVTLPLITLPNGAHDINVYVSNPNNGTDELADNNTVDVSFTVNNQSIPIQLYPPVAEGFESGSFPPNLWTRASSIGGTSGAWKEAPYGAFGTSVNSAMVDFFSTNTANQRQELVSPFIEIPLGESAAFSFSYAYARKDSLTSDSLIVSYSLNCGDTWNRIWAKSGLQLQTALPQNTAFVPGNSDWERIENIHIGASEGQNRLQVKFEAVSNNGNNIYLDDINLYFFTVGINEVNTIADVKLYPNPANGLVYMQSAVFEKPTTVQVFDLQGKLVLTQHTQGGDDNAQVNIAQLQAGMYVVKVQGPSGSGYSKLLVD